VRGEYLAPALILLLVGGVRGLSLVYYLNEQRDVTIYQPYVETTVPARAEIHYPELETPPGLLRLEQLAQREMAAREEGRKRHEAWEREQAEADESP